MRTDGRYAPSPTGELHLGNLRTALLAWLFARSASSRFLLRIEDLDRGRSREEHVRSQLADLHAIGIDWDGEPVRQSGRATLYRDALERLRSQGLVYRCFCSRRDVREAASAAHGDRPRGGYPGTCARLARAASDERAELGEPFCLRLRAEGASAAALDRLHGPVESIVDDLVLVRRDGAFAYNLAVVVDDHEQGVGEVVRGDDLLAETPAQAHLLDLLGLPRPTWTHVALILGGDGQRLAKRHGSVSLRALRELGFAPAEVAAFLAGTLGLVEPGAPFDPAATIEHFDPAALPREPLVMEDPPAHLSRALDRAHGGAGEQTRRRDGR